MARGGSLREFMARGGREGSTLPTDKTRNDSPRLPSMQLMPSGTPPTGRQRDNASSPGLIIPTSPWQATMKSTYSEAPTFLQKKINVKRNESQVTLALKVGSGNAAAPMRRGKMMSISTATRNATTLEIGGGSFSPTGDAPRRTSSDVGEYHDKTAIPPKSPLHAAHVSSENTLVTDNLRSVVSKELAAPKTRKTQILHGLNSLRQPLHSTPDVPYLQQSDIRQTEYKARNLHSENTKWYRKHVEHGKK